MQKVCVIRNIYNIQIDTMILSESIEPALFDVSESTDVQSKTSDVRKVPGAS